MCMGGRNRLSGLINVKVVYYFQVGLDCDIATVVLEMACYVFHNSFCQLASSVLEDGKSVFPVWSCVCIALYCSRLFAVEPKFAKLSQISDSYVLEIYNAP